MEFKEYLKQIRKDRGISLNELARRSGVSNGYLSQVENGKRSIPSPDTLKKIATHLNVNYEEMMERAGYISRDIPEELKNIGVDWIGLVNELKDQDISPEYIREIVKLLNKNR